MTSYWDLLFLINVVCVFVSWKWATVAFKEGNQFGGWFNLFASALNAAIVLNHFI